MTSSVDTAETPRIRRVVSAPDAPVVAPLRPAVPAGTERTATAVQGRCERRAEQRAARRQRRLWALLGIGVMVAALVATVSVLDMVR